MADYSPEEFDAETAPVRQDDAKADAAPPVSRRRWRNVALMVIFPLLLAAVGGYFYLTSGRYVSTDNAYVQQDVVSISPDVGGRIIEVGVVENQRVEAGDILFRIEPRPFEIALHQADADIAAAQLQFSEAQTVAQTSGVNIEGARENIAFAQANLDREQALMDRGFNTRARLDAAHHEVQEARERLRQAQASQRNAQAAVGAASARARSGAYPAIAAAMARREEARYNLDHTIVRAPSAGIVSQIERLQVGQIAVSGVPALTIVGSGEAWITANFKETDLGRMRVGQPARITFDAYPGVAVAGHVESVGAGTGSEFSLLPAQNANGNWVKVTQRVPVRIAIDGTPQQALIAGLSATVRIDIRRHGER